MGKQNNSFPKEKIWMKGKDILAIINKCYDKYLSPQAREDATNPKAPFLSNMLLRLRDFATVVECKHAMSAGDIGRVLNIWKRWSVMAQGIPGLTNCAIDLPRMYLLITKVFNPGLRHVIKHSLLITPSRRADHFIPKDHHLENRNFWLKYTYNHSGVGTSIHRLKDEYSLNIPTVSCYHFLLSSVIATIRIVP
jgi:hypothetical protein